MYDNAFSGTALKTLSLGGNKLEILQPGIFNGLDRLLRLELNNNCLENITEKTFNSLHQLKVLSLSANKIRDIDINAFHNTSLTKLSLQSNYHLGIIKSETFQGLEGTLKFLNFENNYIPSIEDNAFAGLNLEYLNFTVNNEKNFRPEEFTGLTARKVKFSETNVTRIENGVLN